MGIPVLILGESGSGKSTSLRNFKEDEVAVFNVAGKPLPFRKKLECYKTSKYEKIKSGIEALGKKVYVVDDSQYLMAFSMFDRAKEVGYGKFTDIAVDFKNLISYVIDKTPDNCIVYFLHHVERDETGRVKAKTSGKMLDQQLTVEGLFSIVLMSQASDGNYKFITQSDGYTTCKSPMEMFEVEIDNDLKMVDATIREYWGL